MATTPDDVIADLDEGRAEEFDEFLARLERVGAQLATGMVAGQVRPGVELRALRAAIVDHLRDEVIPQLTPHRALAVLDGLGRRGITELEVARPALERARQAASQPPAPPTWPELAALRALPPAQARLAPGITHAGFAVELADRGAPVPGELMALYAATDGLELRNPTTDEVVFALAPARELAVTVRDGQPVLRLGGWDADATGHARVETELWLAGGALTGALTRRHPTRPPEQLRFAARLLDVRAVLRFALSRVAARRAHATEDDLGIVAALHVEQSWPWYFASDDDRFELLRAGGHIAAARAWCAAMIADLDEDVASCTRAGDHGDARRAERQRERWQARLHETEPRP